MTSSSLEATTTRNYLLLLMSKMEKKLTENTFHVWPKEKNDHWLTQSDHWVTVIPPELQTFKAVMTAVLFFHFNVIL